MTRPRIPMPMLVLLAVVAYATACGDGATEPPADPPRATTLTITPATVQVTALRATEQLTAEVRDQDGNAMAGATVSWASSAPAVATVDASGLVTAVGNGTTTITATSGSASGSASVTVAQAVSAVAVSPAMDTLVARGDTVRLTAEAIDANGHAVAGAEFTWASRDTAVAVVDASGRVAAVGNGTATITATSGSASGNASVTVAQEVSAVAVTPAASTVFTGDTLRLEAEAADANGHPVAEAAVDWASSDTLVVVVNDAGLVTGVGAGEAEVTATAAGVTGRAALTVVAPAPTAVGVTPDTVPLTALGQTAQLAAEVRDQIGRVMESVPVSWSSADTTVAAVDSAGLVTAIGGGATTVTATAGEVSGAAMVTVTQSAGSVVVSPAADTIAPGDTLRLAAEAFDDNGHLVEGAEFRWSSSDVSVASLVGAGLVTGVAEGTATVTATAGDASGTSDITVVASAPTAVGVTPDTVALTALGQTAQLAAEVRDQIGRVMESVPVSWSSADTTVAAVDSAGLVTAIGGGATTVAATAGEVSGAAVVAVTQSAGSVVVSPAADTIAPGDTLRLAAEAFDDNGHRVEGAEFRWSSSDVSVAWVAGAGLVTGVADGTATVTATARDASGTSDITVENPDRAALVALYHATGGPNWVNSENWLTDAPLGAWYGVRTNASGRVVVLRLWENQLTGPIPPELGKLAALEELRLSVNDLTGSIPPELGNLTRLTFLSLAGNDLTGPIPPELANLPNLEQLLLPGGVCVPADLLDWAVGLRVSAYPCESEGRLLPSALMREDGNGLSLALPSDLLEPSAVTVSDRSVVAATVAAGWLKLVPRGRGSAEVEVVPSGGGDPASARVVVRAAVGTFGIDIVMDRPAPVSYEEGLTRGADWWSAVLDGTEWPNRKPTCFNERATALADELLIHAWVDSETDFAGYALTCFRESGKQGGLDLDPGGGAVVAAPQSGNPFLVRHEIGHLLGLVLWSPESGLVTEGEDYLYFVGQRAVAAFLASGGDSGLPGVPFDGFHWAFGVRDFMGWGSDGTISAAALADAGYAVDMTKAKDWPAWSDNAQRVPEFGGDVVLDGRRVFVVPRRRSPAR
ncbi:MAG: Ig-like domain-containing protein [Gammaproteobacteria bacterium]|nr:Ig-like domain-containing protein [Gammaproteobacteria bacterium]